jgi:hypothetical protein
MVSANPAKPRLTRKAKKSTPGRNETKANAF